MNPLSTATRILTFPVRTAGAVAVVGVRTTSRVAGWAVEHALGSAPRPGPSSPEDLVVRDPRRDAPGETVATEATTEPPARKAPARKAPARKAPAKKAPARKAARKAPSKKAAVVAPALGLTEDEAEDLQRTPSGIPAAGDGYNPDTTETDLHQPGTEPVMDPATVKAAVSESEMMRRAADRDKG